MSDDPQLWWAAVMGMCRTKDGLPVVAEKQEDGSAKFFAQEAPEVFREIPLSDAVLIPELGLES